MEKLNQVMLYVDDVDKVKAFWTETLEFVVVSETPLAEDYVAVEVSPTKDAETSLTIMAKEFIEKYSPEVNLGTPSLMFKEKNFDALYSKLNDLGLTGHDIVEMNGQCVFNFQDGQGNYFAVMKQSILIFIQTYILIFGLNFSIKVLFLLFYAIVCTNLLTFLESVTKLVLYSGWKRFPMQKLTGGD